MIPGLNIKIKANQKLLLQNLKILILSNHQNIIFIIKDRQNKNEMPTNIQSGEYNSYSYDILKYYNKETKMKHRFRCSSRYVFS